ncbi:MAG: AAA family ATPase, partial [Polyangiaceae bacterium]|nr:AAA family ATPase [Polyangiaceae bacterium]
SALEGRFIVQPDKDGGVLVREDASGFVARQLLGRATPTVGREKEIALLQGVYAELLEDATPRAALVIGPAGIGKSRVRSELMQRLEMAPVRPAILVCRGDPMSRGGSLSALGRTFRALIGIYDGEEPREQVQKIQRHVAGLMPRNMWFLAAFLGELTCVPFPDENDEPLRAARASAQLMQSRLRMALEAYIRARAGLQPQILLIEDMHWADDTTIELVDWLLGCPDMRLGIFAFARPEIATRLPQLWERRNVTRLTLSPLSPLAADRLVAAALPSAEPQMRANIVRRAGGNALFLEELVRCAAEGRDELPLTVQALVQLRLDRMSISVRQVLRAGAVFGQSFWTQGIEALLERRVDAELAELQSTEIIARQSESRIAGQEEWIFRQALVRDAAYAAILDEDRSVLHLAAGAWLESVGDVDAGLIALHADAGGDRPRAAMLYARATRQAVTNGAQLETALDLADRGLRCGAEGGVRAQLLLAKAHVCFFIGRVQECLEVAEEASRFAPPGSDMWGEAQRLVATALIELGRSADGDARAAWALHPELSASLSQPIRACLLAVRVRSLVDLQRPIEALQLADYAVEAARLSGSLDATLRTLDARLFAVAHMNDLSEAVSAGASLIAVADSAGDVVLASRARLNTGSVLNHLGMFEDAQEMLERALTDSRARRMRIMEAFALHNLGMSLARLGNLDEGIDYQRQAARIADECNAFRLQIHTRVYESVFLVWRGAPGDLGAALSIARYVEGATREHPALQIEGCFLLSHVQLARRAIDAAVEAAREANQRLLAGPVEEWEEFIRLNLVEALVAAGELEEADTVLEAAYQALVDRVESIRRPDHRTAFIQRNEEVRRLVELAKDRLGHELPPLSTF